MAIVLGAVAVMIPSVTGLLLWLDPIRRKENRSRLIRVAALEAVPADGIPRKFPVLASRKDAWNKYPPAPIGAVYLVRREGDEVRAFNVACPHAGCFVSYRPERHSFLCPCHDSSFSISGAILDPESPSPRGLDTLEVEIRNEREIWVRFQNFQALKEEKIPVA